MKLFTGAGSSLSETGEHLRNALDTGVPLKGNVMDRQDGKLSCRALLPVQLRYLPGTHYISHDTFQSHILLLHQPEFISRKRVFLPMTTTNAFLLYYFSELIQLMTNQIHENQCFLLLNLQKTCGEAGPQSVTANQTLPETKLENHQDKKTEIQ